MYNCSPDTSKLIKNVDQELGIKYSFSYMGRSFEFENVTREAFEEFFKLILQSMPQTTLDTCPDESGMVRVNISYKIRKIFLITERETKTMSKVKFFGGNFIKIFDGFSVYNELRVYIHEARINQISYLIVDEKDAYIEILADKESFFTNKLYHTINIGTEIKMEFKKEKNYFHHYKGTHSCDELVPFKELKDELSIVPFDGSHKEEIFFITVQIDDGFQIHRERTLDITLSGFTFLEVTPSFHENVIFVIESDSIKNVSQCSDAMDINTCQFLHLKYTIQFNGSCTIKIEKTQPKFDYPCLVLVYFSDPVSNHMSYYKFTSPYDFWKLYGVKKPVNNDYISITHSTRKPKIQAISSFFAKQYLICLTASIFFSSLIILKTTF